jgi:DNA-directed RNA polymerase subunit RPC12/RpoP
MSVNCEYVSKCIWKGSSSLCATCENNSARNQDTDFYIKANDNPVPEKGHKVKLEGPKEKPDGYKCPVCGKHAKPHEVKRDKLCPHCGYKMDVEEV